MERDDLEVAYDASGSVAALGRQLGVTRDQARYRLAKAGIPTRRVDYRNPGAGLRRYGPDHPNWKAIADLPPDLARLYDEAGSIRALARHLGVTRLTAAAWLRRAGIAVRRCGFKAPRRGVIAPGTEHPTWQTGTPAGPKGYIYQYAPDHPAAARYKGRATCSRTAWCWRRRSGACWSRTSACAMSLATRTTPARRIWC